MESYTNEKGEQVMIESMDDFRLIHAIAKYAKLGKDELVKALKSEAIKRLTETQES